MGKGTNIQKGIGQEKGCGKEKEKMIYMSVCVCVKSKKRKPFEKGKNGKNILRKEQNRKRMPEGKNKKGTE